MRADRYLCLTRWWQKATTQVALALVMFIIISQTKIHSTSPQSLPLMTASRRPPRAAGRSAKPDSLRAAHQQITRNNGTLADIADLIELEGKAHPARLPPGQPSREQSRSGKAASTAALQSQAKASGGQSLEYHPFGIPVLAILLCALIVGAAVGVPLGVLTYGTAIYSAVMDSLAVF